MNLLASNYKVEIVDSHQKVLAPWARYRKTLAQPPRLITLDHHTDTSRPFRRLIESLHGRDLSEKKFDQIQNSFLEAIQFSDPQTIEEGISKLNNDEHIVAAVHSNIISSAFVIAHNAVNTDLKIYKEHQIACYAVDEVRCEKGNLKPDHDGVLELTCPG